jgi:hypothetical protein
MPTAPSRHARPLGTVLLLITLAATVLLAACSSSSAGAGPTATPSRPATATTTATATSTPSGPGTQNFAWVQPDSNGAAEVWATLGGAAARQISHNTGSDPCSTATFGPPVISPEGAYIAVAGGAGCGDGQEHGSVFIVSIATGVMTPVPGSDALTNLRSVGWFGPTTIWFTSGAVYTYVLGAASASALPGTTGAQEAVVRNGMLFYIVPTYSSSHSSISSTLHRYSLTTHHDINTIALGSQDLATDRSPGDFYFQGWDASPDGAHVVYQVTTAAPVTDSNYAGIGSSHVYYANADGSSATPILQYMSTTNLVRIRSSPDGTQVAVTEASPAPDLISGCVASPGTKTDPCFHSYTLPAGASSSFYPAWSPDGRSFLVTGGSDVNSLYRCTIGSASAVLVQASASNPWAV